MNMWPFKSRGKSADDDIKDEDLPPASEIVQTSFNPAIIPDLDGVTISEPPPYYRFGIHPFIRVEFVGGLAGVVGFCKGFSSGFDQSTLRYRAENAHLTPTSEAGWYLYNKSKNYHGIVGGATQGVKTGCRFFAWASLFSIIEGGLDAARGRLFASKAEREEGLAKKGQTDVFNTVSAAVAVAGIHSWWHGLDRFAANRMTKTAIKYSLLYGLAQDLVAWNRGERAWYAESMLRMAGKAQKDPEVTST